MTPKNTSKYPLKIPAKILPSPLSVYVRSPPLGCWCTSWVTDVKWIVRGQGRRLRSNVCVSVMQISRRHDILTFIRTHRKSHTKELWGLLGPQEFVLCPCYNRKTIRAISIGIYMQSVLKKLTILSLRVPKRPQEILLRLIIDSFSSGFEQHPEYTANPGGTIP